MSLDVMVLVVAGANLLGGAMAIPQVVALYRSRNVAGVSGSWAGASCAVNAWWAVYGLGQSDMAIIPVSIFSVTVYLLIAIAIIRFRQVPLPMVWRQLLWGLSVGLIPLPVLSSLGWTWVGLALGVLYAVQLSPAVITVYRTHDVSGVAAGTWMMAWFEALLWGVYALPINDIGLLALAATGVGMSSLVLARLYIKRPRRRRDTNTNDAVVFAR